ncbi:hypothetical protein [Methanococcoides seepicolus]|uniref:Uncharacterized protein n=1 Tax=Methanococcoides seepicolus TaxID=2828780 RepID=A0A9E4ZE18_9EURY|nr:hypothetical protein [Methanococcoides seepicolus]MCM1985955.1 hypothetical protein [Methanococcoides seepicolus]
MLLAVGTVSASGGSSYSNADTITVPEGRLGFWSGTFSADDWYQFSVTTGDNVYIDAQATFVQNGGHMKLHDDYEGDIEAHVSSSNNDHTANVGASPQPRIEIYPGTQFSYKFVAGINT